jgi:hypothetical protein
MPALLGDADMLAAQITAAKTVLTGRLLGTAISSGF